MSALSIRPLEWQGRRLQLARAVWFVTAALACVALVASIPAYIGSLGAFTEAEHAAGTLMGSLALYSPSPQFEFWADVGYDLLSLGAAGTSLGLAALIFFRRPREPVAFFVSLILLLYGVVMAGPLEFLAGQSVLGETLVQFVAMPLWGLIIFLFYIFPDGRFVPRWTRWFSLGLIPWAIGLAFWPIQTTTTTAAVFGAFLVIYTLPSLTVPIAQIYRYRRVSSAVERQQTKWVILGFTGFTLGGSVVTGLVWAIWKFWVIPVTSEATALSLGLIFAWRLIWPVSLTLFPLSMTVAVLRYRLWDIDLIVRRTLIYGALTALLALVYFGAVVGLQGLFTVLGGQARSELVTVLSTLIIAALFVPLRRRVQTFIDHRFYRSKYDATRILAQYGARVRDDVDLDGLTEDLLVTVERTMQPAHVTLWLAPALAAPAVPVDNPPVMAGGRP